MTAKRISIILLCCAIALSIVTIVIFSINGRASTRSTAANDTVVEYTLRDYNGHLAVFHSTDSVPYKEFDIMTSSFDDYDRKQLLVGIKADSEEKLRKLIEDYTS